MYTFVAEQNKLKLEKNWLINICVRYTLEN